MRSLVGLLVLATTLSRPAGAGELAVVVNPQNPVAELSVSELREILLMERQHWGGGRRIYLILPASGTPEKGLLLGQALRMNEDALRRHYLGKLYGGEIPAFPGTAPSGDAARKVVSHAPNALAVVDSAAIDPTVKVLRIGGRRPGDAGYLLAGPR
jgi:ABC-type phosphate transport system substrate-binding protein